MEDSTIELGSEILLRHRLMALLAQQAGLVERLGMQPGDDIRQFAEELRERWAVSVRAGSGDPLLDRAGTPTARRSALIVTGTVTETASSGVTASTPMPALVEEARHVEGTHQELLGEIADEPVSAAGTEISYLETGQTEPTLHERAPWRRPLLVPAEPSTAARPAKVNSHEVERDTSTSQPLPISAQEIEAAVAPLRDVLLQTNSGIPVPTHMRVRSTQADSERPFHDDDEVQASEIHSVLEDMPAQAALRPDTARSNRRIEEAAHTQPSPDQAGTPPQSHGQRDYPEAAPQVEVVLSETLETPRVPSFAVAERNAMPGPLRRVMPSDVMPPNSSPETLRPLQSLGPAAGTSQDVYRVESASTGKQDQQRPMHVVVPAAEPSSPPPPEIVHLRPSPFPAPSEAAAASSGRSMQEQRVPLVASAVQDTVPQALPQAHLMLDPDEITEQVLRRFAREFDLEAERRGVVAWDF